MATIVNSGYLDTEKTILLEATSSGIAIIRIYNTKPYPLPVIFMEEPFVMGESLNPDNPCFSQQEVTVSKGDIITGSSKWKESVKFEIIF